MKKTRLSQSVLPIGLLLLALTASTGCAIAKFGPAEVTPFEITVPSGLIGQDKAMVMRSLGDPDVAVTEGAIEYWGYRNLSGWFFSFYVAFGMNQESDLVVEFSDNVVRSAYLIDKGSAIGIMTAPLSVAN